MEKKARIAAAVLIVVIFLAGVLLAVAADADARRKPVCVGLTLPGFKPPNCMGYLPGAPMLNYGAHLNLSQVNKDLRLGGTPRQDRMNMLNALRHMDARKVYDWQKTARRNRVVNALVPCLIGAVFGAAIGTVVAWVTGDRVNWRFLAGGAVGGCLAEALKPARQDVMRRVSERIKA